MYNVIVNEKGGQAKKYDFEEGKKEVTIGRVQGNDIILSRGNVSKRHSRIVIKDGKFIIVDLQSTNGTYVNGRKITTPQVIKGTDKIYIGDFILSVEGDVGAAAAAPPPPSVPVERPPVERAPVERAPVERPPMERPPVKRTARQAPPPPPKRVPDAGATPPRPVHLRETTPPPLDDPDVEPDMDMDMDMDMDVDMKLEPPPTMSPERPEPAPRRPRMAPPRRRPVSDKHAVEPPMMEEPPEVMVPHRPTPRPLPPPDLMDRPVEAPRRTPLPHKPPRVEEALPEPAPLAAPPSQQEEYLDALKVVQGRLQKVLEMQGIELRGPVDDGVWEKIEGTIEDLVEHLSRDGELSSSIDHVALVRDVLTEAVGLGPLEDLMADGEVSTIMVNSPTSIYMERSGEMVAYHRVFSSAQGLYNVADRLVASVEHEVDTEAPLIELQRPDGCRVRLVLPPLAPMGPVIEIRKPSRKKWTIKDLAQEGFMSPQGGEFLELCLQGRRSVIIYGGHRSGRTSLLGALAQAIPLEDRVLSVEDVRDLALPHRNWVRLEAGADMSQALRVATKLRPDWLLVDGAGGPEVAELAVAAASGGATVIATAWSSGSAELLGHLSSLALTAGLQLSPAGATSLMASAFQVAVQVGRLSPTTCRVLKVTEVRVEGDGPQMTDLFYFKMEGMDAGGRVKGRLMAGGSSPKFIEDLKRRGVQVNQAIFRS